MASKFDKFAKVTTLESANDVSSNSGESISASDEEGDSEMEASDINGEANEDSLEDVDVEDGDSDANEQDGEIDEEEVVTESEDEHSGDENSDNLSLDENADDGGWMDAGEGSDNELPSSDDESIDPKLHGNAGWADAMAKILKANAPKGKKTVVLARAKKLSQIAAKTHVEGEKGKEDLGFEIDGETEGEDVKPKVEEIDVKPSKSSINLKPRRERLAEGKVQPTVLDRERERALSKIATKGVVQLFNAVRQQQKDIETKMSQAGGRIRKEEAVLKNVDKRAFLDVLMGNATSERVEDHLPKRTKVKDEEVKEEQPSTWSVLQDNFMSGANLKDWNKSREQNTEDDDEVTLH